MQAARLEPCACLQLRPQTDAPFEHSGFALGFALDDVEDPNCLIGRASRQTFAVVIELGIMLPSAKSGAANKQSCPHVESRLALALSRPWRV